MKTEAKVGLFVVFGFVILLGLSTQLSMVRNMGKVGYEVYVQVPDASGLNIHAKVKMNGVDAGEVLKIELYRSKVRLTLFINEGVLVPINSTVALQQESMLGGKILNIDAGDASSYLQSSEEIAKASSLASFEETSQKVYEAADAFTELMTSANRILDAQRQEKLQVTIDNLSMAMKDIKELVSDNKLLVHETIQGYKTLSDEFIKTGRTVNKWLPGFEESATELVKEYSTAGKAFNELLGANSEPLNAALKASGDFFETGKSALIKVDRYLASLTESELQISMYGWYMSNDDSIKVYTSLFYLPSPSTYYMFKIASTDDYSRLDASGNLIVPKIHEDSAYLFSVEYGKRFGSILARAGLQDSTGSAGLDYFTQNDKLKFSMDIFDLNAINDVRGTNPHLTFGVKYEMFEHVNFYAGVDNFLNPETLNIYLGLGMEFVDDHLKYFLSGQGGGR